ncbi:DsbC family protein [Geomesophilobacter sediminis]|uniref:DsbC family protein n=1 Tax=Geomesophilobacter sediminis TaxID=2798584 RepID=A0A8J7M2Q7_9BACT|nr:DsbC family protein [Geomesophilobacter sediminis]MBJ6727434.1 DsbC family protein [Geomesophilobacter sediminis]
MSIAVRLLVVLCVISLGSPAFAMNSGSGCGGECASCHSLSNQEAAALLKDLGQVKAVKPAQVRGLFEVEVERNGQTGVVFVDYGKKNLIAGQIFDIATLKPAGPAAEPRKKVERLDPNLVPTKDSLLMGNPNGKKRLFVFTDPECPYCKMLHAELKKLVEQDPEVAIYIKLYPLKMHPHAYDKARVILGEGSLALLERSFAGEKFPAPGARDGKKGVDETMKFAETYGINSTPTVILPDGKILPGVRPARELEQLLGGK